MSENKTNETAAPEQELSELLQIRRDKLKALQEEGRDPFTQTRFVRSAYSDDLLMCPPVLSSLFSTRVANPITISC